MGGRKWVGVGVSGCECRWVSWRFMGGTNGHGSSERDPIQPLLTKMGGEFPYPNMVPLVLTHSQMGLAGYAC